VATPGNPFFERLLPRLVAIAEAGRLVPFIGSGMSRPVCSDWLGFVQALEREAGTEPPADPGKRPRTPSSDELIRRANAAVRALKGRADGALTQAVRRALIDTAAATRAVPPQAAALARVRWPLVLTTNYDNCYAAGFEDAAHEDPLAIVGRGVEDCQRVLNSLSMAGRPLLWALQGHLTNAPRRLRRTDVSEQLEAQLVVGHEEYRRVTYREPHFRRAFAEVFRQRSLLFLGAGLQENYMQELFGEVLETYGPATRPHYAFVQKGDVDTAFLLARLQIVCVEYPKTHHEVVVGWLNRLAETLRTPQRAPVAWSWGRVGKDPDFELVRGALPDHAAPGECLAVSAGGSGKLYRLSAPIRKVVNSWGVSAKASAVTWKAPFLGRFEGHPVFAVRARDTMGERSLAEIHHASRALFDAVAPTCRHIRLHLLATGGATTARNTDRVLRHPARFSFVQTVRAWGAWRRANPDVPCRLTMHVLRGSVTSDVASGRIDVLELLSCEDMRFFVEVMGTAGEFERRLFLTLPTEPLRVVVDALQLAPMQWEMRVTPPARMTTTAFEPLRPDLLGKTLEAIGVLPGSTIHLQRVKVLP